ncbi:MAG: hypothetical protein GY931_01680 [Maribacter sp.]|nr:hypothetical protein [Maribacter sp.]
MEYEEIIRKGNEFIVRYNKIRATKDLRTFGVEENEYEEWYFQALSYLIISGVDPIRIEEWKSRHQIENYDRGFGYSGDDYSHIDPYFKRHQVSFKGFLALTMMNRDLSQVKEDKEKSGEKSTTMFFYAPVSSVVSDNSGVINVQSVSSSTINEIADQIDSIKPKNPKDEGLKGEVKKELKKLAAGEIRELSKDAIDWLKGNVAEFGPTLTPIVTSLLGGG